MNKFIITAQILSNPKIIKKKSKIVIIMLIAIPNNKKEILFFNCKIYIKGNILNQFSDFYRKQDFFIIEGNIKTQNYIVKNSNLFNKYKWKKYLLLNSYMIQPYIQN